MRTKTVRVPGRGGPEMKTYWTEVEVPVFKKRGTPPPPPNFPPQDEAATTWQPPKVGVDKSQPTKDQD